MKKLSTRPTQATRAEAAAASPVSVTPSGRRGAGLCRGVGAGLAAMVLLALGAVGLRAQPAYLVAAPDRGFLGNEEVREAVESLRSVHPETAVWFVTEDRTDLHLRTAVDELAAASGGEVGPDGVVVLPLFLTRHHALYQRGREAARALEGETALRWAPVLGESYLAEEILFDRVAALSTDPATERLVLVGTGAGSVDDAERIREALMPLARRASEKHGLGGEPAVEVLYHGSAPDSLVASGHGRIAESARRDSGDGARALVVPFGSAMRYTTMMSDWRWLGHALRGPGITYRELPALSHEATGVWLRREATRHRHLARNEVGVIFVPHGADFGWNETMRAGLAPLRDDYVTADAFSMVDPVVVERAVRDLEDRGMKAAVVVRIFSLASSFREKAEYVLGLRRDVDGFPHRIRTHLELHTLGGLERDPRFVEGLVDRMREISEDPSRETLIVLGHGAGEGPRNDRWMENLGQMVEEIRVRTDGRFRDYLYHTWQEDWPEERERSVAEIRGMVERASEDGGTALVVPARTGGEGPAAEYLRGLDYRYATGFSPHPAFTEWVREQIEAGIEAVRVPEGGEEATTARMSGGG